MILSNSILKKSKFEVNSSRFIFKQSRKRFFLCNALKKFTKFFKQFESNLENIKFGI